jgi:hypothetical protein
LSRGLDDAVGAQGGDLGWRHREEAAEHLVGVVAEGRAGPAWRTCARTGAGPGGEDDVAAIACLERATGPAGVLDGPSTNFTAHSTDPAVALEPDGDFRIDDVLDPAPPVPCTDAVLLIRNSGGAWFAAGIPKN